MAELLSAIAEDPRAVQLGQTQPALARAHARRLPLGRPRRGAGESDRDPVTRLLPGVMTDVLPSADDGELFGRAKRLGFAGVEVILRRAEVDRSRRSAAPRPRRAGGPQPRARRAQRPRRHRRRRARGRGRGRAGRGTRARLGGRARERRAAVPFFGRAELRDEADIERAAGALRPLCRRAAERGVALLYEGTLPSESIRRLAAAVDSPAFGCYFDTANVVTRAMDTATSARPG